METNFRVEFLTWEFRQYSEGLGNCVYKKQTNKETTTPRSFVLVSPMVAFPLFMKTGNWLDLC